MNTNTSTNKSNNMGFITWTATSWNSLQIKTISRQGQFWICLMKLWKQKSQNVQLQHRKHHQQNTTGVLLPSILITMKSSNFLTSSTPHTVTCQMDFLQSVQSNYRWKADEKERLFRIEATSFEHFCKWWTGCVLIILVILLQKIRGEGDFTW